MLLFQEIYTGFKKLNTQCVLFLPVDGTGKRENVFGLDYI
jgi:hypothetical protein